MTDVTPEELLRLRAIEHHCWHLLDDSGEDGVTLTIDLEISRRHLDRLNELLTEEHPPITMEESDMAKPGWI